MILYSMYIFIKFGFKYLFNSTLYLEQTRGFVANFRVNFKVLIVETSFTKDFIFCRTFCRRCDSNIMFIL